MVNVDDSIPEMPNSWLGLMVGSHLMLFYIHEINRANSCNGCAMVTAL